MAATAGRKARVKVSGTPTAFTAQAFTNSGDNKTYQITNTTMRVWSPTAAITVKIGGVTALPGGADPFSINRLSGKVIFVSANGGRAAVTADGTYLPVALALEAKDFRVAFMGVTAEDTALGDADVTRLQIAKDVSGSLGRWWIDSTFAAALDAGTPIAIDFYTDDAGTTSTCKAWAMFPRVSFSAARRGLVEEAIDFEGSADADGRAFTFNV
jgi:hypothetical protein